MPSRHGCRQARRKTGGFHAGPARRANRAGGRQDVSPARGQMSPVPVARYWHRFIIPKNEGDAGQGMAPRCGIAAVKAGEQNAGKLGEKQDVWIPELPWKENTSGRKRDIYTGKRGM